MMREVKVVRTGGKLAHQVEIGNHHMIADEPFANQGEDLGPNPFEYLCVALGACTALTAQLYAQHKGWLLEDIDVRVTLARHEGLTTFDRKINFLGPLEKEQKEKLLEIVNHCPVHKILTGSIRIDTFLMA
jgi:putative redox protein